MHSHNLPVEIQDLIAALDSIDQLQILLMVLRSPSQVFHSEEIAQALRLTPEASQVAMDALQARRLIVRVQSSPGQQGYQYAPATITLHVAAEELAVLWETHSMVIIKLLYQRSDRALRAFANAFRLRRHDTP
jgi:hypothetical protein